MNTPLSTAYDRQFRDNAGSTYGPHPVQQTVEKQVGEGQTRGLRSFSLRLMSLISSVLDASHPSRPLEILF